VLAKQNPLQCKGKKNNRLKNPLQCKDEKQPIEEPLAVREKETTPKM
jgi:hypothetical protein